MSQGMDVGGDSAAVDAILAKGFGVSHSTDIRFDTLAAVVGACDALVDLEVTMYFLAHPWCPMLLARTWCALRRFWRGTS